MTNIEIIALITTYIILFITSMLIFSKLERSKSNKQREKILQEITQETTQETLEEQTEETQKQINNLTNKK